MLDHVFTDAIASLREVLEAAMLEPQAVEERFHGDVLLGDLAWQTSYSLPGEGSPPRVQADIVLEWPTWSQSAYRSWRIGDQWGDPPRITVEIVLRLQRLRHQPVPDKVLPALPALSASVGSTRLERSGPRIEIAYDTDLSDPEHAIEVSYEGTYELDEATLADPALLDEHFSSMGGWIASTLVRLGDLDLEFLPPDEEESQP
jgi:hypothetical protein